MKHSRKVFLKRIPEKYSRKVFPKRIPEQFPKNRGEKDAHISFIVPFVNIARILISWKSLLFKPANQQTSQFRKNRGERNAHISFIVPFVNIAQTSISWKSLLFKPASQFRKKSGWKKRSHFLHRPFCEHFSNLDFLKILTFNKFQIRFK